MRNTYRTILKKYLHERILSDRLKNGLVQEEMAERLLIDWRSYIDLEHGKNLCSTTTFIMYLLEFCDDPSEVLSEIRALFEKALEEEDER